MKRMLSRINEEDATVERKVNPDNSTSTPLDKAENKKSLDKHKVQDAYTIEDDSMSVYRQDRKKDSASLVQKRRNLKKAMMLKEVLGPPKSRRRGVCKYV